MTTTLRFSGYSDDTFGEYALTNDDFDNCASGEPIRYLITAPGVEGGVLVIGQHAAVDDCCWVISVAAYDPNSDDLPLPPWPICITPGSERAYTPDLVIEVPDNYTLRCLERTESED